MIRLILFRIATGVITLFLAAFFVFFAVQALPGDVAQQLLGQNATPEAVETLRAQLGLDANVWSRFGSWITGAVVGDFGTSLVSGLPVADTLWGAFGRTLLIALPALVLGVALALALGVRAGARRGTASDSAISLTALIAMSIPEFVVATVLVLVFAIAVPVFPAVVLQGADATLGDLLHAAVLPALTLTIAMSAYIIRAMRSSTIDTLATEYATTAELKGVPRAEVLRRHVVPNALLPVLPVVAINVAWLLGGVVVVESVFNYPGLGTLMIESVSTRDLPTLQAIAVLSALIYVAVNLVGDVAAVVIDPRQRALERRRRPAPVSPIGGLGMIRFRDLTPSARIGIALVALTVVVAVVGPFLTPYSAVATDADNALAGASIRHWLGTDQYGRDILTRTLEGGRYALLVAACATTVAVLLGTVLGTVAASGRLADTAITRVLDAVLAVPSVLALLLIVSVFGNGLWVLVVAISVVYAPAVARVVRGATRPILTSGYVVAARARGERLPAIIVREVVPNILDTVLVEFAMRASWVVLLVSTLSFLGFGVSPPAPDWGLMIQENRSALTVAPAGTLAPIVSLAILVVGINLAADGLSKYLGVDRTRRGVA